MNYIRQQLLTGWHFARWIRLIIGVSLIGQAVYTGVYLYLIIAALFLFQVVTNTGCSAGSACSIPAGKGNADGNACSGPKS